jgi:hypothetical protein
MGTHKLLGRYAAAAVLIQLVEGALHNLLLANHILLILLPVNAAVVVCVILLQQVSHIAW